VALFSEKTKLISEEEFSFKGLFNKVFGFLAQRTIKNAHRRHMEAFKRFCGRPAIGVGMPPQIIRWTGVGKARSQIDSSVLVSQVGYYPILVIGTVGAYVAARGNRLSRAEQDSFKQAEAQLNTLATESGGLLCPYAKESDLPILFKNIETMIGAQHNLSFNPGDTNDGKPHKIVVKADANVG
jgi:hypothetical protein